tara:strand:+ start:2433 stop:2765 length:333 start_codon:yes stop_codon:yes gene_type:complete
MILSYKNMFNSNYLIGVGIISTGLGIFLGVSLHRFHIINKNTKSKYFIRLIDDKGNEVHMIYRIKNTGHTKNIVLSNNVENHKLIVNDMISNKTYTVNNFTGNIHKLKNS